MVNGVMNVVYFMSSGLTSPNVSYITTASAAETVCVVLMFGVSAGTHSPRNVTDTQPAILRLVFVHVL